MTGLLFDFFKYNSRACRYVEFQPTLFGFRIQRVVVGEMTYTVVSQAIAAKLYGIGIEHDFIRSLRNQETIIGKRTGRTEIEHKDVVATHVGQHLVAIVMPYFDNVCLLYVLHVLYHLQHCLVKITQIVIAQVFVIHQAPLTTGIFVAPSVTLAREVYPFGMTELVPHEVQITAVQGRSREQTYHLMQSNAAMHAFVLISLLEVPIHIGIYQTEDDGLIAHESLIVTLGI